MNFANVGKIIGAGLSTAVIYGCGSGGLSGGPGGSPNSSSRAALLGFQHQTATHNSLSGSQTANFARNINGSNAAGGASGAPSGNNTSTLIGSFIRNLGGANRSGRKAHISRDINFYYDDYLGLWVRDSEESLISTVDLFLDEGATKSAGQILSTWTNFDANPSVYTSNYFISAGPQAGTKGNYSGSYNSDGSGSWTYDSVTSEGFHYSGTSVSKANGDYQWSSNSSGTGGYNYKESGIFHVDGTGSTHSESSDGHGADFNYNADGTGSGKISGPEAGLPARIVWDAQGIATITWADGTTETWSSWWGVGVDGGVSATSGSGSGGTSTQGVKVK